jgi:hypothetical protein
LTISFFCGAVAAPYLVAERLHEVDHVHAGLLLDGLFEALQGVVDFVGERRNA